MKKSRAKPAREKKRSIDANDARIKVAAENHAAAVQALAAAMLHNAINRAATRSRESRESQVVLALGESKDRLAGERCSAER